MSHLLCLLLLLPPQVSSKIVFIDWNRKKITFFLHYECYFFFYYYKSILSLRFSVSHADLPLTKRNTCKHWRSPRLNIFSLVPYLTQKKNPCSSLVPEILMRVVSILPPLAGIKLSVNVGPPLRLILDKLTFTNSRLMLRESFLPVTEDGSSSTVMKKKSDNCECSVSLT